MLKKQSSDRVALASKLKLEKKQLFEAKAQDFLRLKKRLRNAEAELKKTHIRQQLLAEKKLVPLFSYNAQATTTGPGATNNNTEASTTSQHKNIYANSRSNVLRNSGLQRMMMNSTNSNNSSSNNPHSSSASFSKSHSNTSPSHANNNPHPYQSSSSKPLNARDLLAQRSAHSSTSHANKAAATSNTIPQHYNSQSQSQTQSQQQYTYHKYGREEKTVL